MLSLQEKKQRRAEKKQSGVVTIAEEHAGPAVAEKPRPRSQRARSPRKSTARKAR
jgi:hypothetical protein